MKSSLCFSTVLPLAMLASAIPTTSDGSISAGALRIPLQRGSRISGDHMPVRPATGKRFMNAKRAQELVRFAYEKYMNTFAAYERNTGSRHPLDTLPRSPSIGLSRRADSGTVPLTNYSVELWYGDITVGTPPMDFTADFDTGSADLVLFDSTCVGCLGHQTYDPTQSRTSELAPYPPALLLYGSGSAFGPERNDVVAVAGYNISKQGFLDAVFISPGFWNFSFPVNSLVGLGLPNISGLHSDTLVDNLNHSGLLPERKFGFKLSSEPGQSALVIGGEDRSAYKLETRVDIPVTHAGYWQVNLEGISQGGDPVRGTHDVPAIMDTGTTLIVAPCNIAEDYFGTIPGAKCGPCATDGICTVPCDIINQTAPMLTFGGRNFQVSNESWNLGPTDGSPTECIAGMGASTFSFVIVGDVFLQNVYTIFDFLNLTVGLAALA